MTISTNNTKLRTWLLMNPSMEVTCSKLATSMAMIHTTRTCMKLKLPTIHTMVPLTIMKVYIRIPMTASTVFKEMPTLWEIDTTWTSMRVNLPTILTTEA